jgi:hypothetical protein
MQLAKLKQQMIQDQVCTCVVFSFAFVSQRHGRGVLHNQFAKPLLLLFEAWCAVILDDKRVLRTQFAILLPLL